MNRRTTPAAWYNPVGEVMTHDTNTLAARLAQLGSDVSAADGGDARANGCGQQLDSLVARALALHEEVRSFDREQASRMSAGQAPSGAEGMRPVTDAYGQWYRPARRLLDLIDDYARVAAPARRRDELLAACRQASLPATVDVDRLMRGIEQARRGEGIPLQEAMNALRRQPRHSAEPTP